MKLTNFALIFVAVILPVVMIVYINVSFILKAEKQEMYYKNVINSATQDAVAAMKKVGNEDIDYGYSGIVNNKISINAEEAIKTFYRSLANNFKFIDNEEALNKLKMYIPVIAVLDYDGIYIHSAEVIDGRVEFTTKPKIKYTITYTIIDTGSIVASEYKLVDVSQNNVTTGNNLISDYMYEVTYTMDDYIFLKVYDISNNKLVVSKGFYLTDEKNNDSLVISDNIASDEISQIKQGVIKYLSENRRKVIANLGMKHITYAINKHNDYAKLTGIKYNFKFTVNSDEEWYDTMNGIGVISVIQGISLGNRYLNHKAYSISDLTEAKKYYASISLDVSEIEEENYESERYYLKYNLYHQSQNCPVYQYYVRKTKELVKPAYYLSRAEAATQGYHTCPVCKP